MARTRFTFREKAQPHTYATTLASSFTEPYPPEWLISGASLYRKYDEGIVRQLLEAFVPERARVLLMAKNHSEEVIGFDPQWLTEKWYGTQYIVRKLDDALLQRVSPSHRLTRNCAHPPSSCAITRQTQSYSYPRRIPTSLQIFPSTSQI